MAKIKVPRCLKELEQVADSQLHVFTDASQEAYGGVAYQSGTVTTRLVMSKPKVTPLKAISVPRIELMAAIVGLQIADTASQNLGIPKEKRVFWSDSLDVLYWVRGRSRRFKLFASNRVGEVQTKTDPAQWVNIPIKANPADKLTRGTTADSLINDQVWWNGPEYLSQSEEMWPTMPLLATSSDDVKRKSKYRLTFLASSKTEISMPELNWKDTKLDPERFSDWFKFLRVIAYVVRFVQNCLRVSRLHSPLTVDELSDAEVVVLRQAQLESYREEVLRARKGEVFPLSSKILPISPVLGSYGLLRGNSRLRLADNIACEARRPVILPRKQRVTRLIVDRLHKEDSNHAGTNQVLASLSARFWLPGAREEILECERACMVCRRLTVKPASQIMPHALRSEHKCHAGIQQHLC